MNSLNETFDQTDRRTPVKKATAGGAGLSLYNNEDDPSPLIMAKANEDLLSPDEERTLLLQVLSCRAEWNRLVHGALKDGHPLRLSDIEQSPDEDPAAFEERRCNALIVFREWKAARAVLTERNLRMAMQMARKFQHRGVPLADLVQEGIAGILRSIDGHNGSTRLSTYATWWIRQKIQEAISKNRPLTGSRNNDRDIGNVRQYFALHPRASYQQAADALGIPIERLERLFTATAPVINLNGIGPDDDMPHDSFIMEKETRPELDTLEEAEYRTRELPDRIAAAIQTGILSVREANILCLRACIGQRFGIQEDGNVIVSRRPAGEAEKPLTLGEIGKILGVTKEAVRLMIANALRKLRHNQHLFAGLEP